MKKTILSILGCIVCVLLSCEGATLLSSIIIYGCAITISVCIVLLWKAWQMDSDELIKKILED